MLPTPEREDTAMAVPRTRRYGHQGVLRERERERERERYVKAGGRVFSYIQRFDIAFVVEVQRLSFAASTSVQVPSHRNTLAVPIIYLATQMVCSTPPGCARVSAKMIIKYYTCTTYAGVYCLRES